jgi:hypothetical protein
VIVTDEQASWAGGDVDSAVPPTVPAYTWNLAGYRWGHGPSGSGNRHTFGGLTDQALRMIPLLEAGRSAAWPWEQLGAGGRGRSPRPPVTVLISGGRHRETGDLAA